MSSPVVVGRKKKKEEEGRGKEVANELLAIVDEFKRINRINMLVKTR